MLTPRYDDASQGEEMAAALAKNAVTMCVSMSAGDAISQQIQAHYEQKQDNWDTQRTAKMGTVGLCVQGPLFHGRVEHRSVASGNVPDADSAFQRAAGGHLVQSHHLADGF